MKRRMIYGIIISVFYIISCNDRNASTDTTVTALSEAVLIPKPVSVTTGKGAFELTGKSSIYVEGGSQELMNIGQWLADKLNPPTGFDMKVKDAKGTPGSGNNIYLNVSDNDPELGDEGYLLNISEDLITLTANKPAGLFRGIQTIRQLLPDSIELGTAQKGPWKISSGIIRDYPTYPFRSSMLDVSRHFFSVDDVKRYIDLIAFYKMNFMHLHLADDQGWRIEIKSWPNLATYGGSTQVGGGKGGFYTQEQYKDIVNYAADRYITIIPEIDMPGHTNAALASYPELNCNNKAPALYTKTEVGFSSLCVRKDTTYKFIDDVVRELAALTPGPYIHLGGDESHATKKDDYISFIDKVQDIVQKHGKQMIGWEEISQSSLKPGTIVQYWSNAEHAVAGVKKGAKIIMSPATKVYLDMKYDSTTKLGLDWAARIEIDSAYNWKLSTRVPGIARENILGIEAPLWSETVTNMDEIEYLVFPRLVGVAELGWSPEAARNWDEYKVRLGKHAPRMKVLGIDYYKSKQITWTE